MTMSSVVSKVTLNGDGVQTKFPFAFKVWKAGDLEVSITSPAGANTVVTDWTVVLGASGGTVTYPTVGDPLPLGWKITIRRFMDFLQDVDLVSGTRFDPEVIETALDIAAAERQQLLEEISRSVRIGVASTEDPARVVNQVFTARDQAAASVVNAKTERIRAETQRGLAQQAAAKAQASAADADTSEASALASATKAANKLQELINAGIPVPIGMMAPFPVNRQPSGWAVVMGQTLQRTVYPQAVAFLTGNDTTPSFTLPDLRGEFVRGADLGRGVDAGRAVGSWQDSQNKAHNHGGGAHTHQSGNSQLSGHSRAPETASGRNRPDGGAGGGYEGTTSAPKEGDFIASDGGAEARSRNVAVVWCIKLANHPVDITQADINAVLQQLNTMAKAVNPNNGKYSVYPVQMSADQRIADGVESSVLTTRTAYGPLVAIPNGGNLGWTIQEAGTYRMDVTLVINKLVTGGATAWIIVNMNRAGTITHITSAPIGIYDQTAWHLCVADVVQDCAVGDILFVTVLATGAEFTLYRANSKAVLTRLR